MRFAIRTGMLALASWSLTRDAAGPRIGRERDGREAASHFLDELRAGRLEPAWQGTTRRSSSRSWAWRTCAIT